MFNVEVYFLYFKYMHNVCILFDTKASSQNGEGEESEVLGQPSHSLSPDHTVEYRL